METKSKSLMIRLTNADHEKLQKLAESAGVSMAEYIRRLLNIEYGEGEQ